MEIKQFRYPGDPPTVAHLLTGKEFVRTYRNDGPGVTEIRSLTDNALIERIEFTEVICDLCNALITDEDECLMVDNSYLYCPACKQNKMQYVG